MTTQEWLNTPCPESDLKPNPDGSVFIPIATLKGPTKLGNKQYIQDWDLFEYTSYISQVGKQIIFNAHGRLMITFADGSVSIKPGGTSFPINGKGNTFYESTAQSEVIKNAAKNFGNQFGFHLNQDLTSDDLDLSEMPPNQHIVYETLDEQIKRQSDAFKK